MILGGLAVSLIIISFIFVRTKEKPNVEICLNIVANSMTLLTLLSLLVNIFARTLDKAFGENALNVTEHDMDAIAFFAIFYCVATIMSNMFLMVRRNTQSKIPSDGEH